MKEYLFNFHDIVLVMTMSECVLLAVFQALMPTQSRISSSLLTLFFLLICLNTASILLLWNAALQTPHLNSSYVASMALAISSMLKGPALYFYLRSICEPTFVLRRQHLVHLLPLLLSLVAIALFGMTGESLVNTAVGTKFWVSLFLWSSFKLAPVFYAVVCAYTVRHVGKTLMNHYSDESDTGADWAKILVLGYLLHWSWSLLTHVLGSRMDIAISDILGIVDNYLSFIMINLLFVYSIVYARRLLAATMQQDRQKKIIANELSDETVAKVTKAVEIDRLFLEQNINIDQFARRIGLTSRDVSNTINSHFNSNFFEFINKYRVEEAQRLLSSDQHREASILDILYDSGFNSKSAFNRFFKRIVGISPSEYRKAQLKN